MSRQLYNRKQSTKQNRLRGSSVICRIISTDNWSGLKSKTFFSCIIRWRWMMKQVNQSLLLASLHSVSKPDVRDELNSLSRDGAKIERKKLQWNFKWFLPSASSNHVSNPEELEARKDRSKELLRIVMFFS